MKKELIGGFVEILREKTVGIQHLQSDFNVDT